MMERMHRYAYWHGRQARLSGEAIDYLFGPPETWVGLLASTPGRLSRSLRMEARSERTLWTRAAYVGLDMLSHLAWGLGGIAGAKAAPGP